MITSINGFSEMMPAMNSSRIQRLQNNPLDELDTDGNGSLNQDEFQVLANKIAEATGNAIDFSSVDTDDNDQITMEELAALHKQHGPQHMGPPPTMQQMVQDTISQLDSDGNGTLNATEASPLAEKISAKSQESTDTDSVISEIDTNGDGEISATELQEYLEKTRPHQKGNNGMSPFQSMYNNKEGTSEAENAGTLNVLA